MFHNLVVCTITTLAIFNSVGMVSPQDELEHHLASGCIDKSIIGSKLSHSGSIAIVVLLLLGIIIIHP